MARKFLVAFLWLTTSGSARRFSLLKASNRGRPFSDCLVHFRLSLLDLSLLKP